MLTLHRSDAVAGKYFKGDRPWGVDAKYDIALPCATQNEVSSVLTPRNCESPVAGW